MAIGVYVAISRSVVFVAIVGAHSSIALRKSQYALTVWYRRITQHSLSNDIMPLWRQSISPR